MSEKEIYENWVKLKALFEDIEKDVLKFAVKKTFLARTRAVKSFRKMKKVIKKIQDSMLEEEKMVKIQKQLYIEQQKRLKEKK